MLSLVVAVSRNNVIGCQGSLPWHLPNDLKFFKFICNNKPVIMGNNTRKSMFVDYNIKNFNSSKLYVLSKFTNVQNILDDLDLEEETIVAGGSFTYDAFFPYVNRMYVTLIDKEVEGDSFFNLEERKKNFNKEFFLREDCYNGINYKHIIYDK